MTDKTRNRDQCGAAPRGRAKYVAPVLREFGRVGMLTQSGTGQNPENMMMGGPMRLPMA